ncbi:putative hydroquinone glucosyltransferase [Medicago truncatula]|uniref:Glycosyltransferase n=1 Tax=Medicago truncatula TaxID=3880 RepID=A0A072TN95_MEDTR|nr:hydroquinone glucosyltransferase [Medicago truncatula]KEH18691.1 UDP-glucosyltransferase family protein [Medicago truncatula]RHN39750.1 putative hydroquinone glucosyltransferase [Medicago truncatula]
MEYQQQSRTTPKQELPPLVAMFPTPGMGHLIPMVEFAKRLSKHNLPITFIIPNDGPPSKAQTTVLTSLPHGISHVFLPPVTLSDLPPNTKPEPLMIATILRSLPSLHQTLLSLMTSHRLSALIIDLFGTDAFDMAAELDIPSYLYFPSTANMLSFAFYFPQLDQKVQGEFRDILEPLNIPGCFAVHGKDLPDPVQDRKDEAYKCFLHQMTRHRLAKGIIENSFFELEPEAITFLQKNEPPVYPVGPLVNEDSINNGSEFDMCFQWLDEQPRGSVIYVNFGSEGILTSAQTDEIAYGLEMSEQRFLWVLRCPKDKVENDSNFIANSNVDPFEFLPNGFTERTKGKGLVLPYWAPQAQVLSHISIGGFVSHCGWNSTLESVVNGVPLIAWPLYAEQKMNAVLLSENVKVAIRPKVGENGLVQREEIASVVKRLMVGEEEQKIRYRMKDLKEAAINALKENGSSTKQICELALKWKGVTIPN